MCTLAPFPVCTRPRCQYRRARLECYSTNCGYSDDWSSPAVANGIVYIEAAVSTTICPAPGCRKPASFYGASLRTDSQVSRFRPRSLTGWFTSTRVPSSRVDFSHRLCGGCQDRCAAVEVSEPRMNVQLRYASCSGQSRLRRRRLSRGGRPVPALDWRQPATFIWQFWQWLRLFSGSSDARRSAQAPSVYVVCGSSLINTVYALKGRDRHSCLAADARRWVAVVSSDLAKWVWSTDCCLRRTGNSLSLWTRPRRKRPLESDSDLLWLFASGR